VACKGPVWANVVVVVDEAVQLPLQRCKRLRGRLACQIALERLVQALNLPARLRVVGA
jgi:hypothetical protein